MLDIVFFEPEQSLPPELNIFIHREYVKMWHAHNAQINYILNRVKNFKSDITSPIRVLGDVDKYRQKTKLTVVAAKSDESWIGSMFITHDAVMIYGIPQAIYKRSYGIDALVVDRKHRHKGIATAMLEAGYKWLKDKGETEVLLSVTARNHEAIRLYKKQGFKTIEHQWAGNIKKTNYKKVDIEVVPGSQISNTTDMEHYLNRLSQLYTKPAPSYNRYRTTIKEYWAKSISMHTVLAFDGLEHGFANVITVNDKTKVANPIYFNLNPNGSGVVKFQSYLSSMDQFFGGKSVQNFWMIPTPEVLPFDKVGLKLIFMILSKPL